MKTLQEVIDEHPRLHVDGYGGNGRVWRDGLEPALDPESAASIARIEKVRCWLAERGAVASVVPANVRPITGSGIKVAFENEGGGWVSNGEVLAAILMDGYPVREVGGTLWVGIRKRSFKPRFW